MKKISLIKGIFIGISSLLLISSDIFAGEIIVPWRAKKEIVKQGSSFEIWFKKEPAESIVSVTLAGPFNSIPLRIKRNKTGLWYFDEFTHATYNCSLSVVVPSGTPIELYDLLVQTSSGTYTSRSAVKVIDKYLSHYYICHFTDPHVAVSWANNGNATAPIMQALAEIISVIDPELAVCTGDNIIGFSRTKEIPASFSQRWDSFWDGPAPDGFGGVHNIRVPVFATTGNNDYDKFKAIQDTNKMFKLSDWNIFCGMRVFGFSYDQTRFLAFDDFLGELKDHAPFTGTCKDFPEFQVTALEKYLSVAGPGKLRIVLQHSPVRVNETFCNNHQVPLVLSGHIHKDQVTTIGTTPTNVCATENVCFAEYWSPGYPPPASAFTKIRIVEVNNNVIVSNQTVNIMDYIHVMNGLKDGKLLTVSFDKPNNGKDSSVTATIVNKTDYSFSGCKIRFVMPKGKYSVDKGTIQQSFSNDLVTVYDVKIPVGSSASVTVTIKYYI